MFNGFARGDGAGANVYRHTASDLVYGPGGFTGVMNSVLPRKRLIAHALITDPWDRVCLMETTFKPDWELPGGIVNTLESPWEGAVREIAEEMSLDHGVGRVLVIDWLGPYLGWEDAVELIFDGGTLTQEPYEFPGGRRFHFREPGGAELAVWSEPEPVA